MLKKRWYLGTKKQNLYNGIILLVVILIALFSIVYSGVSNADIPPQANQYKRVLTSVAHMQLGLNAPVATLAAQVHQESRWQPDAVSKAGAQGLAQFMPATANWMPDIAPTLGTPQPFNPAWALRAMVTFDAWLLARTQGADACEHWAFALAAYNGGLSWIRRDLALASDEGSAKRVYFNHAERHNAGRSVSNKAENQTYVRNILTHHEALYVQAGWGSGVCEQRWTV